MRNASLALFVYGAVVVVCRIVFARLPDRVPSLALAAVTLVVMAAGLLRDGGLAARPPGCSSAPW